MGLPRDARPHKLIMIFDLSAGGDIIMDKDHRLGVLCGLGAYFLWGLLPIYWKQLHHVPALEILANRFIWSAVFVLLILLATGRLGEFARETRQVFGTVRSACTMLLAAVMIAFNWGIFIWAVEDGRILETSLGYYINPLISVLFGMVFLKERLNRLEWIAVALAAAGIGVMVAKNGSLPWVSIVVPATFAVYGLLKKLIRVSPFTSIMLETLLISPLMLWHLGGLWLQGTNALQTGGAVTAAFLVGAGAATATPLLLFTACARILPLNMVGFMQYLSPTMSLLIGVFVYGEAFTLTHALTFGLIWLGLGFYICSQLRKV